MPPLSAEQLLWIAEVGRAQPPVDRPLVPLAAADPRAPWEELAGLGLGEREVRLLELRAQSFGALLQAYAECPHCGEKVEITLDAAEMAASITPPPQGAVFELEAEGYALRFRLLAHADLQAAALCRDEQEARRLLVRCCVLEASQDGAEVPAELLPEPVVARLARRLEELDAAAEMRLDLACPRCGLGWAPLLDVGEFLWAEIRARARRLLLEVHTLARAYGWSERDILAMRAARREAYLAMVGA